MLPKTNVEYAINKDGTRGYAWNWLTGCANGSDICKTRETCWAKTMAGRFHRDFTPTFHEDKFNARFPRKPGARILVCFTGDISYAWAVDINRAWMRMFGHPEHTFLLLTKRPKEAYRDIEWPRNAWLGGSLTGAESKERQQQVIDELRAVKGQHKLWLSFEPMLFPLRVTLEDLDWLVLGAQPGKGAVKLNVTWNVSPYSYGGPRWYKNNIGWAFGDRPQELPGD